MYNAQLDDGRVVIVDTARDQTRSVGGADHFIDPQHYVRVLLDGGWQTVRSKRLKKMEYGNPFKAIGGNHGKG